MFRSWLRRSIIAILIMVIGVLVWRWRTPTPVIVPDIEIDDGIIANPGYVGAKVCGECHNARLHEFEQTRHFRATWTPENGPMPNSFTPQVARHVSRYPQLQFEMSATPNGYQETVVRDRNRESHRIDWIYGAGGRADEVYFTWKGDRLYELPIGWLWPTTQWGEQMFNPDADADILRTTTPRCVECHNTWGVHIPGTENEYRRDSFIMGVQCEKCHGPAQQHVNHHREHQNETVAHSIVHPGQLSRDRQMDVCAQCHSNAPYLRAPAFTYRPGEPLENCYRTLKVDRLEDDHVADQVRYLKKSQCYQHSDSLTCVTCHNPHKLTNAKKVESACLQCHQPADCHERERLPMGVRDQCVSCHMPNFNRIAVKFHTADDQFVFPMRPHDHRIAVYPHARDEVLATWYRSQNDDASRQQVVKLSKSLTDYWFGQAETFRANQYPFTAEINQRWGMALLALEKWHDAELKFRHVLKIDPKLANAHQGLSVALRRQGGHSDESLLFARRAVKLSDQQNADMLLTLVDAYAEVQQITEAIETANRALSVAQKQSPELVRPIRKRLAELQKF